MAGWRDLASASGGMRDLKGLFWTRETEPAQKTGLSNQARQTSSKVPSRENVEMCVVVKCNSSEIALCNIGINCNNAAVSTSRPKLQ